jgi:uncharacterized membrane protein
MEAGMTAATTAEQRIRPLAVARAAMRWVLAAFFVAGGIAHLAVPEVLLTITPAWVPFAPQVIFVTGLCELAGAAALVLNDILSMIFSENRKPPRIMSGTGFFGIMLGRPLRTWAGIALALYALCVWPANIKQALDGIVIPHIPDSWWYHGPRLALQPVIIWAALFAAGVIDWPFAALRRRGSQGRPPA